MSENSENMYPTYTPQLPDLSGIILPGSLQELGEKIAKHVHDEWSVTRIKDGWTNGATRDNATKQHNCLVPYEDLPDSERKYDRNTAKATLQLVISMGYSIEKKI